jgi:RNA recognition motif-containing protein
VEFFFSDSNFARDKFLKQKTRENKDRYVDISVLLRFNTLKALTTDIKVVADSLKGSELVEVNESGLAIRRKSAEMPDEQNIYKRRIFVEGLPKDATWIQVRDLFQVFGKVSYVGLRRDRLTKQALGSATVDFESEDAVKKAVENPPSFRDEKLKNVMAFQAWLDSRKKNKKKSPKSNRKKGKEQTVNTDVLVLRVKGLSNEDVNSRFREIRESMVDLAKTLDETDVEPKFVDVSQDDNSTIFVRCQCTRKEGESFVNKVKETKDLKVLEKSVEIDEASEMERDNFFERMRASARARDDRGRGQKRSRNYRGGSRDTNTTSPKKKMKVANVDDDEDVSEKTNE